MDPHQGTASRAGRAHHARYCAANDAMHMVGPHALPAHAQQQAVMSKAPNHPSAYFTTTTATMMMQPTQGHAPATGGPTTMVPAEYQQSWRQVQATQHQHQITQDIPQPTMQHGQAASRHGGWPSSPTHSGSRPHPKKSRSRLNATGPAAAPAITLLLAVEEEQAYKRAFAKAINTAPLPPTLDPALHKRGVAAIRLLTSQSGKCPITRDSAIFLFQQALSLPRVQRTDPFVTAMAAFMLACKTREQEIYVETCDNMIHALGASSITKADITSMELHLLLSFDWRIHPFVPSELLYPMLVKTLGIAEFTLLHARHPRVDTVSTLLQIADACVTYYFTTLSVQQSFASMRSIAIMAMVCARACLGLGEQGWCPTLRKWAVEEEQAGRGPYPSFDLNVDRITRAFVENNPGLCDAVEPGLSTNDSGIMSEPPTPGHPQGQGYPHPQYPPIQPTQGDYAGVHGMPSEQPRPRVLREASPASEEVQQREAAASGHGRVDSSYSRSPYRDDTDDDDDDDDDDDEVEPEDVEVASCFRSHSSHRQRKTGRSQEQAMHQLEPLPPLPSMMVEGVEERPPLSAQTATHHHSAARTLAQDPEAAAEPKHGGTNLNDENAENIPLQTAPSRSRSRVKHRTVRRGETREPLQVLDLTSSTDDDDDDDDDNDDYSGRRAGAAREGNVRQHREPSESAGPVGVSTSSSVSADSIGQHRSLRVRRLPLLQDMTEPGADLPGDDDFYDLGLSAANRPRGRAGPQAPNPYPEDAAVNSMQLWSPGHSLAREVRGLSTQSPCHPPKTPKMSHSDRPSSHVHSVPVSEQHFGARPPLLPTTHSAHIIATNTRSSAAFAHLPSAPSSSAANSLVDTRDGEGAQADARGLLQRSGGSDSSSSRSDRRRRRRRQRHTSRPAPKKAP